MRELRAKRDCVVCVCIGSNNDNWSIGVKWMWDEEGGTLKRRNGLRERVKLQYSVCIYMC